MSGSVSVVSFLAVNMRLYSHEGNVSDSLTHALTHSRTHALTLTVQQGEVREQGEAPRYLPRLGVRV